ncbi:MAG: hypothetical protein Q7U04_01605 [Bacteriovorax sp.]|nr:hypothetical protein [Bacteriovorax sp.]
MKLLLACILLTISGLTSASECTSVIKDRSGYQFESFTRSSYSQQAACDQAIYDCNGALSYGQSVGRYYDAHCEIQFDQPAPSPYPRPRPGPGPSPLVCQTDLVDYYGSTVRSFTAPGSSEWDACNTSDNFCKTELARNNSYGYRCVNRGLIGNRNDPRPPSRRTKTEQCSANRYDPSGMYIQSYNASATGPMDSDVLGVACRNAMNMCSSELRGRQTCNIAR